MIQFKYRKDIDGLRALAVLSVIIFHINPNWLPSGFLGVDIFFVLSGFLITSIIYREIIDDRFSFKDFYIRRMKRILPLFFVVILVGLIVSGFIFMPHDVINVANSAIFSVFFLANRQRGGYFDIDSDEKPFLHIWSLSIEEQFYFVFPILLLLLLKISIFRRYILGILGIMILFSLLSAFLDLKQIGILWDQYYMPQIRAGELLIGSFLAIYSVKTEGRKVAKYDSYISVLSLIALVSILFLDNFFVAPLFPGILALFPCVLTAVLIYINKNENIVSNMFSYGPIVWIGKLSYSLYLWHWVVLAIVRYVTQSNELSIMWIFISIVLIFSLSILTYYYVETPLRGSSLSFKKSLVCFYIVPSVIVLGISFVMKNFQSQLITSDLLYPTDICHNNIDGNCIKGDKDIAPRVLVVGNSYVGQLNPWIDIVGKREGWSAVVVSSDSCLFLFDDKVYKENRFYKYCSKRDKYFRENYKKYPIIVFHYTESDDEVNGKLLETWSKLIEEGKKVYVITGVVEANVDPLRHYYLADKNICFKEVKNISSKTADILEFVPKSMKINKVDLRGYIPDNFYIEGKPIYKDKTHWNTYGAEKIANRFIENDRFIRIEDLK